MHNGLAYLNADMQAKSLAWRNAFHDRDWYAYGMAAPRHAWHLKAWLKALGIKQAQLVRDLEMNKAKVSLLVNQKQPYDQDDISTLSEYFDIAPYELLMHPNDAAALRQFRQSAEQIAGGEFEPHSWDEFAEIKVRKESRVERKRTGTHG